VDYLGGAIHRLEPAVQNQASAPFPTKLSETGLFRDTRTLTPHAALIAYQVQAPAWHDGATSERHLALPGGEPMEVMEQGGWNFSDGTAVAQTLTFQNKRIETRVLLRQQGEWAGYSYAWNDAQTDAALVPEQGETRGNWRIPGRQECMLCHSRASNFTPGLSTVQLNRPGADGENQLARWERLGLLTHNHAIIEEAQWRAEFDKQSLSAVALQAKLDPIAPAALQRAPAKHSLLLPRPASALPRMADPHDEHAPLAARARAYLHANCAHCHVRNGGGNSNPHPAARASVPSRHAIVSAAHGLRRRTLLDTGMGATARTVVNLVRTNCIVRTILVAMTLAGWFVLSNHCALGRMAQTARTKTEHACCHNGERKPAERPADGDGECSAASPSTRSRPTAPTSICPARTA